MEYYNIEKQLKSDDEPCCPSTTLLKEKSVIITAHDLLQKMLYSLENNRRLGEGKKLSQISFRIYELESTVFPLCVEKYRGVVTYPLTHSLVSRRFQ